MQVTFCGYHTHNVNHDVISRPQGLAEYLFLLVLAPMTFTFTDGQKVLAKRGACLLYTPGTFQHYQAETTFFNSFVEFTGLTAASLPANLPVNRLFYPTNEDQLNRLLQKIHQEFLLHQPESGTLIDLYLQELLLLAARGADHHQRLQEGENSLYHELHSLRLAMLADCQEEWSAEKMCDLLQLGKSQFYRLYQQYFHTTPNEELIWARLQLAIYHMTNRSMTIQEAAYQAGFANINHFHRLFKKRYGCTPSQYRSR